MLYPTYELGAEFLLDLGYFLIRHIIDSLKRGRRIGARFLSKIFFFYFLPQRRSPGRTVYPIGYITDMEFFRQVTLPHILEDISAHFTMKHAHSIDLLREIGRQEAHGEFLVRIVYINFTKSQNLLPVHMELFGIVADKGT